jgi:hypothetical protein
MVGIFQNNNFQNYIKSKFPEIVNFNISDLKFPEKLIKQISKNKDITILIDSEICFNKESRYQNLEGLRFAYELRTNPKLLYKGCIKLFGFLKYEDVMKNTYSSLIKKENNVFYFRYPDEINFREEKPLSNHEWLLCIDRLDLLFVTEFRKFEHSFQNIRIRKTDNKLDKFEEIQSYFNTLNQIEKASIISKRYLDDFELIKENFKKLIEIFKNTDLNSLINEFTDLKSHIKIFKSKYTK